MLYRNDIQIKLQITNSSFHVPQLYILKVIVPFVISINSWIVSSF